MTHKESETIEFKKSTAELKDAVVAIAAMLNKHSQGEVYFGISDDGKVIGQDIGRMTIKEVTQAVVDHIEPKIYPKVEARQIEGKDCIVIQAHGINSPYFAYGRAYMRVGESNKALNPHKIETLILSKKKVLWENETSERQLRDIDIRTLKDYMRRANEEGRINFKYSNAKITLKKLRLLVGERLIKATEVLFCNDNSMEIQAAVFAGTDKITFLDIKKFKGNIFNLRLQAEAYIKEHIKWRADLSESRRKEIPEIPVEAIREAVGNSLCHRDYSNPKGNEVAIFKDRVEIYNPGAFPDELSPEDFIKGDEYSILRNPLIAETMYLSADIEKWASGLKRIYDECTAVGIKVEFKRVKTGFVVSFQRPKWEEGEGLEKGGQKSKGKSREKLRRSCGEVAEKVFQVINANLFIKTHEIADQTRLSQRTVDYTILKLKKAGFLKRVGPDRGGHWEVSG